ncbi:MAG TPA: hypothetical protein DHW82_07420 [Spirochaetia bacterium]|nr:MAG: hypothetical protein A2Y41_12235 [Spirochaetes bacterium GWB1_36_13]HCL56822.1 hypothetical protein [Spirochaetia bacterium]
MYCTGHILSTSLLSLGVAKRFEQSFFRLYFWMLLANLIDFDHLIFYSMDSGGANSLILHPLHIYSGTLIFFLFLMGMIFKNRFFIFIPTAMSLSLHLAADALAYFISYSVLILAFLDILMFSFLLFFLRKFLLKKPVFKSLSFFYSILLIFPSLIQAFVHYGLKLKPEENFSVYLICPLIILLTALIFGFLYKKRFEEKIL